MNQAEIGIDGYTIYRKDRDVIKEGRGGGVVLFVRDTIISYECKELNDFKAESIWYKICKEKNCDITVGVCYKQPTIQDNELKALFDVISQASKGQVLVMGDFNYPGINWDLLDSDSEGLEFRDLLLDNYLFQHVRNPTRNRNVLDLVISSDEKLVENVQVIEHLGNSDHNSITWELKCNIKVETNKQPYRQYHKANYDEMRCWLRNVDWDEELKELEVNDQWNKFCSIIDTAVEKFVPLGYAKSKKYPRWMNKTAKAARKYKSKMWIAYRASDTYNDLVEYKRAQNKAVKEYRKAKRQFEKKLAKDVKQNPKSFYAYVRSKTKVKEAVGPLVISDGQYTADKMVMSDMLNGYFGSVFTEENDEDELPEVECRFKDGNTHMLSTINLTEESIFSKLKKLKINKAPGTDQIVPRLLIENAEFLCKPLLNIFRKSLASGIVPRDWKRANVTAIFKKGDKSQPCNYRPVSLTSQVCKVMESIIRDEMIEHIKKHDLIRETQHGFIKKRSCLTNLLEFLEIVTEYIDKGCPIDVIYLDFQKAFDKVPHKRLMLKIDSMGISGDIYNWIKDWLKDREQRVVLLGSSSQWISVKSGVPQGSVLGPLLFLIYINDIDKGIHSKVLKFADDTKLYSVVANQSDVKRLKVDLINICNWSNEWLMLFNVEKCKVMHMGYNNTKMEYEMNGTIMNEVTEEKDLGIIIQNDLKCNKQCTKAVITANRILGMIKRSFSYLDRDIVLQLYKSLVRPHLEYCVQAWRPHLHKDIDLIEKVQRRATKLIFELKDKTYEERLLLLNLTTMETRRIRGDLIEVFKIFKGFDDIDYSKFFELSNSCTRGHSLKLFKPGCRLDCRKFTFSQRVISLWNSLNDDIIACESINGFKGRIDKFLKGRGFI